MQKNHLLGEKLQMEIGNEYEYPAGTKVEIIGSGPRGYDVMIVETGVKMCETGMMNWSKTPIK